MKKILTFLLIFALTLGLYTAISAQHSQVRTGDRVWIRESPSGNMYVAGGEVNIAAKVEGDLVSVGGEITVKDSLLKDGMLAGGKIRLEGVCGEDLRIMGGEVRITKDVKGDLTVTAGKVFVDEGVTVHGDVIVAGGKVDLLGQIAGNLRIAGGEVWLKGKVGGDLEAQAGKLWLEGPVSGKSKLVAQEIELGSEARFEGPVSYWQKSGKLNVEGKLAPGIEAIYDNSLKPGYADVNWEQVAAKGYQAYALYSSVSGLLLTILLVIFFGSCFAKRAGLASTRVGKSFATGILALIGLPIFSGLAMITIIGIPVGLIGGAAFTMLALSANAITAVVAANELNTYRNWNLGTGRMILLSGA